MKKALTCAPCSPNLNHLRLLDILKFIKQKFSVPSTRFLRFLRVFAVAKNVVPSWLKNLRVPRRYSVSTVVNLKLPARKDLAI
ncbi:MAG TPA: hypothetical protein VKJ65_08155, partial [Phycisphaerae bacterium]|nr:hypothetical protein [Phycisphaerae bacterium]